MDLKKLAQHFFAAYDAGDVEGTICTSIPTAPAAADSRRLTCASVGSGMSPALAR